MWAQYLIGREPDERAVSLYHAAAARVPFPPADRALTFARKHAWSIAPLDAALALVRPRSALRARLFAMSAILEVRPAYARAFLPRRLPVWYPLLAAFVLLRAAVNAVVGFMLLAGLRDRA